MTHTLEQPGLHAHSWNPATDLLKQYRVDKSLGENKGWLAVASFSDYGDGYDYIFYQSPVEFDTTPDGTVFQYKVFDGTYRIYDQFENESWVFEPGTE